LTSARDNDPGSSPSDVGVQVLDGIHGKLMVDEEWTTRRQRGFTWIAGRLAQDVMASLPFEDVGVEVVRIRVSTSIVRHVRADNRTVSLGLLPLNRSAHGSAWIYDPASQSISLALAQTVHVDSAPFRTQELATFAILQLATAEMMAPALAEAVDGEVAAASHPISGNVWWRTTC
jgi:hypothetical protein